MFISKSYKQKLKRTLLSKKARILIIVLLSLVAQAIKAQSIYTGKVIDANTGKPLAFVNVVSDGGKKGTSTDIDGKFILKTQEEIQQLTFSYLGYQTLVIPMAHFKPGSTIKLQPTQIELTEVTILPGENPALRIIKNALASREANNYENLPAFTYEAYEKMVFRASIDSVPLIDSIASDTNEMRLRKFLEERNLLMIENYYDRKHRRPGGDKQEVKATRVSGFKDPVFVFLITQLQSTTFYNDIISIGERNYINPLAPGSINKYFYQLQDTLIGNGDTIYSIFYRPWKGTRFDGLKGILNISTKGWAIASVTAEPYEPVEGLTIRIQQLYEADSNGIWFPRQLNTDLMLKNMEIAVGKGKDARRYHITASGRSYIRNVNLNPELSPREFGRVSLEVKPDASRRDEEYWGMVRIAPLSNQEEATYKFIDSIGKKQNLDRMAFAIDALMKGKITWNKISFDLQRFLKYNSHEGFYAGLGIETNERLSQVWQAGAWGGYGFKDQEAKYGGFMQYNLDRFNDFSIHYRYRHEKIENGSLEFSGRKLPLINAAAFRDFLITRMDRVDEHRAGLSLRPITYAVLRIEAFKTQFSPAFEYAFTGLDGDTLNKFDVGGLTATVRWAQKEKFIQTTRGQMSLGTQYPIVWFTLTKGIKNFVGGKFQYLRAGIDAEYSFFTPFLGTTLIKTSAGITGKSLPASLLFNQRAAHGGFILFSPGSFATMRMNEFYSDRYASLWISHNFQNLLFKGKKFKPEPEVYVAALWGDLSQPQLHKGISLTSPNKGYFETGLNLHHILDLKFYNLGVGAAWRMGPYHFPSTADNLTLMMTLDFNL